MKPEEIKKVLDDHVKWLRDEGGGRADLYGADLSRANLRGADLRGADLRGADLRGADLSRADLSRADLRGANLSGANLSRADLREANLREADLSRADLSRANLYRANFSRADLRDADLSRADLYGANLSRANLYRANFSRADLRDANLPSPTMMLLASWGEVSDDMCRDLMRYDAACHDDPQAFDRWASGGSCPYDARRFQRAAIFTERRDLYSPGPSERPWDLMVRVIREKCADSDYHDKEGVI